MLTPFMNLMYHVFEDYRWKYFPMLPLNLDGSYYKDPPTLQSKSIYVQYIYIYTVIAFSKTSQGPDA